MTSLVDQAGRWASVVRVESGEVCTDPDCFGALPHPASGPHRFAGDPPPETVTEELVRRIAASLARHPEREPIDAARNIMSWVAIDFDIARRRIR